MRCAPDSTTSSSSSTHDQPARLDPVRWPASTPTRSPGRSGGSRRCRCRRSRSTRRPSSGDARADAAAGPRAAGPSTNPKSNRPSPTKVCSRPSSRQRPQRRRLGVDEPQPVAVDRQPGRLRQPAVERRPVLEPFDRRAGQDRDRVAGDGSTSATSRCTPAQATTTCSSAGHHATSHGDRTAGTAPVIVRASASPTERSIVATTAPSVSRTPRSRWLAVSATTTSNGGDARRQQRDRAGLGERRRVRRPVEPAARTRADAPQHRAPVQRQLDELVVPGVGDQQRIAAAATALAGKRRSPPTAAGAT